MKQRILYCCEVCGKSFDDKHDAQEDEAKCYGLTPQEYRQWKDLCGAAAQAGQIVASRKNLYTDFAFDRAVRELVSFEGAHNLDDRKVPSDFRW